MHSDTNDSDSSTPESDSEGESKSSVVSLSTDSIEPYEGPFEQQAFKACHDTIDNIIDRLFGVSILIRGVLPNFRANRAAMHIERDEQGNDVLEEFKAVLSLRIKWLCRETPEWLVERLANVNAVRRQQFYYQRAHKRKLGYIPPNVNVDTNQKVEDIKPRTSARTKQATDIVSLPVTTKPTTPSTTTKTRTTINTVDTLPTEYKEKDEQFSKEKHIDLAPSEKRIGENIVPNPPKEPYGKAFECTQCFRILPAETRDLNLWRLDILRSH